MPPPPPAAPKKRAKWPWILLAILIALCLCTGGTVAACATFLDRESEKEHTVVYELLGDGTADATYSTTGDGGGTAQEGDLTLPWRKELKVKGLLNSYSLLGQRNSDDGGSITCRIVADGKEVEKVTSSGAFAIAHCTAVNADVG